MIKIADSVTNQSSGVDKFSRRIDRRQLMLRRQLDYQLPICPANDFTTQRGLVVVRIATVPCGILLGRRKGYLIRRRAKISPRAGMAEQQLARHLAPRGFGRPQHAATIGLPSSREQLGLEPFKLVAPGRKARPSGQQARPPHSGITSPLPVQSKQTPEERRP